MAGVVQLIPTVLAEGGLQVLPAYVLDAIRQCQVFFVENERTTRRFFKSWWKEMVIDDYEWFTIGHAESDITAAFQKKLAEGKTIGIVSEAGCPGVADPGQALIAVAQQMNVTVRPLVGPNSILLALMASGLNGQQFRFRGYLPIDAQQRNKVLREMENEMQREQSTQIFIETPYRNNQLVESIVKTVADGVRLCIAVDLTATTEWVKTKTIREWKKENIDIHKRPAIFLLGMV